MLIDFAIAGTGDIGGNLEKGQGPPDIAIGRPGNLLKLDLAYANPARYAANGII
jgi:hypothetical protein